MPVANSPDPCARVLDSGTAGAPPRMDPSDDHDVLARVAVLVNLGLPLIEGGDPVRAVFPITLSTAVDGLSLRLVLGREQLKVRVDQLQYALPVAPLILSVSGG
jgi:hypothetical protein